MSTATNILGKIGEKVGTEIKTLSTALDNINVNEITGGLSVSKADGNGVHPAERGISTDGNVSIGGSLEVIKALKALRADFTQDVSVGTGLSVIGHSSLASVSLSGSLSADSAEFLGKLTAGELDVKGKTTIVNTQTVEVSDNILELNKSSDNSTTATISGIEINRGETTGTVSDTPSGTLTYTFDGVERVFEQVMELDANGQPTYASKAQGNDPEGTYRIAFTDRTTDPDGGAQGVEGDYQGWVIQKRQTPSDINSDYVNFDERSLNITKQYMLGISDVDTDTDVTTIQTHGYFQFSDDGAGLEGYTSVGAINDTNSYTGTPTNPMFNGSNGSIQFYAGDTIDFNNTSGQPVYIYKFIAVDNVPVIATIPNGGSYQLLITEDTYRFSASSSASTSSWANGVMFINGQAPNVQNVAVPKWLVSMQWQYTADLPQRLEDWFSAVGDGGLYGSTIDANFSGDMMAQFPTTLVGVNDGDSLGAQDIATVPDPQTGTATTTNDKAKFLWDNAEDQQKFKLLVGDDLADLTVDDVVSTSVKVSSGDNLKINNTTLGDYSAFESAFNTAKNAS